MARCDKMSAWVPGLSDRSRYGPHRGFSPGCFMADDMCFIVSSFNYLRAPTTRHGNRLLIAAGRFNARRAPSVPIHRHLLIGKHRAPPLLPSPPAAILSSRPFSSRLYRPHRGPLQLSGERKRVTLESLRHEAFLASLESRGERWILSARREKSGRKIVVQLQRLGLERKEERRRGRRRETGG